MVTFYPLSSGSSGNSYYLSAGEGQGSLLIDAGISARRIRTELCDAGIDPAGLRGILITHDHADHVAGLRVLAKQLKLPVYATAGTLERLAAMVEPTTRRRTHCLAVLTCWAPAARFRSVTVPLTVRLTVTALESAASSKP